MPVAGRVRPLAALQQQEDERVRELTDGNGGPLYYPDLRWVEYLNSLQRASKRNQEPFSEVPDWAWQDFCGPGWNEVDPDEVPDWAWQDFAGPGWDDADPYDVPDWAYEDFTNRDEPSEVPDDIYQDFTGPAFKPFVEEMEEAIRNYDGPVYPLFSLRRYLTLQVWEFKSPLTLDELVAAYRELAQEWLDNQEIAVEMAMGASGGIEVVGGIGRGLRSLKTILERLGGTANPTRLPTVLRTHADIFRNIGSLQGKSLTEVARLLKKYGFTYKGRTAGGYDRWYSQGTKKTRMELWIRPNGQVIRIRQTPERPVRYNSRGYITEDHQAGEFIRR